MSYEKEAIVSNPSAIPVQSASVMKEEMTYDPYRGRTARTALPPSIGQGDKGEGTAPVESGATEETVKLSPQVAALARKEQRFRQQQQEMEKERASIAAEKEEIAQLKAMKAKLAAKDYSGLDGLVDYNEYSQYQVDKLNGSDPVAEEIKRLNGKLNDLEKSTQDNVTKQFEAAVSERRTATNALIESSPEFPRIKKAKAQEAVVKHILDTWENDSQELSIEQAAKEVEQLLVEKAKQWAALLEDEKEAVVEGEKKQLPPLKQGLKTLTNQVTAGDIKRPAKPLHHMSDSERWAEARRRVEEKLQQQKR